MIVQRYQFTPYQSGEHLVDTIRKIAVGSLDSFNYFLPSYVAGWNELLTKKYIICGSTLGDEIKLMLQLVDVIAIVDDGLDATGLKTLYGVPVISTGKWIELVNQDRNILSCIFVATQRGSNHFLRQCAQHNFNYLLPIHFIHLIQITKFKDYDEGRIIHYGFKYHKFIVDHFEELIANTCLFSDPYSKLSYLNLILYKLTLNPVYLEAIAVGRGGYYDFNTYLFDKSFLKFSEKEVYVDAGAFTGDSIEAFLYAVNGKYQHIYSFEPSLENNRLIRSRLQSLQTFFIPSFVDTVSLIDKGVWSHSCELVFNENFVLSAKGVRSSPLGGHLIDSGLRTYSSSDLSGDLAIAKVPVISIDEGTNLDATFIKYEVEGSELEGLIGASKTLQKNRPKLAVALYHKPEDILVLPNFIRDIGLDYKIGLRQHDLFTPDATYMYCY